MQEIVERKKITLKHVFSPQKNVKSKKVAPLHSGMTAIFSSSGGKAGPAEEGEGRGRGRVWWGVWLAKLSR